MKVPQTGSFLSSPEVGAGGAGRAPGTAGSLPEKSLARLRMTSPITERSAVISNTAPSRYKIARIMAAERRGYFFFGVAVFLGSGFEPGLT